MDQEQTIAELEERIEALQDAYRTLRSTAVVFTIEVNRLRAGETTWAAVQETEERMLDELYPSDLLVTFGDD